MDTNRLYHPLELPHSFSFATQATLMLYLTDTSSKECALSAAIVLINSQANLSPLSNVSHALSSLFIRLIDNKYFHREIRAECELV